MSRLLVRGGRVVDPAQGIDEVLDVLVEDGAVAKVDGGIEVKGRARDPRRRPAWWSAPA